MLSDSIVLKAEPLDHSAPYWHQSVTANMGLPEGKEATSTRNRDEEFDLSTIEASPPVRISKPRDNIASPHTT